jgi:hypothetical protein
MNNFDAPVVKRIDWSAKHRKALENARGHIERDRPKRNTQLANAAAIVQDARTGVARLVPIFVLDINFPEAARDSAAQP